MNFRIDIHNFSFVAEGARFWVCLKRTERKPECNDKIFKLSQKCQRICRKNLDKCTKGSEKLVNISSEEPKQSKWQGL